MNDNTRMVTTAIIWGAFTLIIGILVAALALTNAELDWIGLGALLIVLIGLMVTVANSTMAIWQFQPKTESTADEQVAAERRAKAKRNHLNRVERLIEELDDDEIYDLEALLLARGNQPDQQTKMDG